MSRRHSIPLLALLVCALCAASGCGLVDAACASAGEAGEWCAPSEFLAYPCEDTASKIELCSGEGALENFGACDDEDEAARSCDDVFECIDERTTWDDGCGENNETTVSECIEFSEPECRDFLDSEEGAGMGLLFGEMQARLAG